ncbi:zinc-binding dehydrogenase [Nitratireductor sp. CAU 1489]|uniref:Zinc-binding dehydrogenase n=1 Tax=Nitratireductor arenosus TaxID=2682096 RepID=A0A844QEQ7_9HYPH|nr:NAD(P)H-quinone oxidoreductase [Nitratireductor arenosus]MVA96568.1 zinc-binding dehydrogenase [Nitratireductor arenosus]
MKVVEIAGFGGPDRLHPAERRVPVPGPGELLVRVVGAGVNRPDVAQRQGVYPPPPGATDLPGLEVAGHVAAVGPGTSRYAIGDAVTALTNGGGYAEYCVVSERAALPVPGAVDLLTAAAIPETMFTVWHNAFERGRLRAGESLLVHGGASGIGTMAIMMAKCLGACVIVTAGSDEKCGKCLALGADHAINYKADDFVGAVGRITGGRGADVILDMVGGGYLERNLAAIAVDGRIVQISFLEGMKPVVDLGLLMRKRASLTGSMLRSRSDDDKAMIAQAVEAWAWPHVEHGTIRPVIDTVFPLEAASEAHARMESGAHFGKVVLEVA